jgi:hypothetical protein
MEDNSKTGRSLNPSAVRGLRRILLGLLSAVIIAFVLGFFVSVDGDNVFTSSTSGPFGMVLQLWMFIGISSICTGGIGLIVWIILFWVLGRLIEAILNIIAFGHPQLANESSGHTVSPFSNTDLAIMKYITDSRKAGDMTDAVIRSNLKGGGWSDEEIERAFKNS